MLGNELKFALVFIFLIPTISAIQLDNGVLNNSINSTLTINSPISSDFINISSNCITLYNVSYADSGRTIFCPLVNHTSANANINTSQLNSYFFCNVSDAGSGSGGSTPENIITCYYIQDLNCKEKRGLSNCTSPYFSTINACTIFLNDLIQNKTSYNFQFDNNGDLIKKNTNLKFNWNIVIFIIVGIVVVAGALLYSNKKGVLKKFDDR